MLPVLAVISVVMAVFVVSTSPVTGLGRWLAPDSIIAVFIAATFGIRPLFTDRFQEWTVHGYVPTDAGITTAAVLGTLASLALALGALLANRRRRTTSSVEHESASSPAEPRRSALMVLVGSAVASASYFAVVVALGGTAQLASMFDGRTRDTALLALPEVATIAPLAGSALIAFFVLSRRGTAISVPEWLLLGASLLVVLVSVSQLGSRRLILPALLIPVVAVLMRRPRPVRVIHVSVGFLALVFLAVVPFVRSAGARSGDEGIATAAWRYFSEYGAVGVVRPIFTQWDTGMVDYVAVVAERLDSFGYGQGTLLEFLLRPIPSSLQPGVQFSDQLLIDLYGGGCYQPYCPVASAPGILYFDGGFPLVVLGSLVIGFLARRLAAAWQHNARLSPVRATMTAIAAAYALIFVRTNAVHALWWGIYAVVVATVALWALGWLRSGMDRPAEPAVKPRTRAVALARRTS